MREYTASWLAAEKSMGGQRTALHGNSEEMRAQFDGMLAALAPLYPPPSDAVVSRDHEVGNFKVRVYTKTRASGTPLPVGLFTHGGGFVLGSLDSEDAFCRLLVEHANTMIISIDYRLSPEVKTPVHLEDCLAGLKWVLSNAQSFGGDVAKIYTIGDSAGAQMALGVARKVRTGQAEVPSDSVKGVVALVPAAFHLSSIPKEYEQEYTAYEENATNVPIFDAKSIEQIVEHSGIKADDADYLVGLDQESHKLFPPTYIVTCEFDPLRDDGIVLAKCLKSAGVPVKYDHYDGLPHVFWVNPILPETKVFMKNLLEGVDWVIRQM
ncbi:uncharacterized protein M437DRAFT_70565 [Aureobasidium melanogenum CBS 110374]|uniref:Alpha/beta hydrolase fold-3 domain-containing protein n=1 Tax=Aureobasidium melanogenum (strain CBS 110374) TaxID=1043003 RepID=A0A074VBP6_AURM1|nr:uncharacterized protein M437DRAFT_70565 [Aureobasidium melanogenum CBS 110374]KEQ57763.1 hypothetical protein M437DRAFT_70565 [Aureobasidium melanogenum CBS 110374]